MCGIAGIYLKHAAPDPQRLDRATRALAHRGPNGHGRWLGERVGLVHTRLSIIDLEGGAQPLHSPDGNLHLVANGEIYNYVELRGQYQQTGRRSLTGSDCEAVLQCYEQDGAQGFSRLNGMYAAALFDQREQTLLLLRDRLGIKPLYYAQTAAGVAFASEIKGLLPLLDQQPTIHAEALAGFLDYQFHAGRDTVFQQIKRVLPGEYLRISSDGDIRHARYWSAAEVQPRNLGLAEAIEEFVPLFDQVMRQHLRADVPLGLFLSGGIDSSVLLARLSQLYDRPLRTYSIGFADEEGELDQANALAARFGSQHTPVTATRGQLFKRIVHTTWAADDLMRDYACLPMAILSESASRDLRVVFSGEGGDEAFAGYRRYASSLEGRIKALLFGSGGVKSRGQWHARALPRRVLGAVLRDTHPRTPFEHAWSQTPSGWSQMQRKQYVDLTTSLPDNLFVKADRIMMAFGLEGRVPFSDHRLVEFGLALPDEVKYRNHRGKHLIRRWAEQLLPKDHLALPKRGFHVPVRPFLSGDYLRHLSERLLRNRAIREWFDIAGCQTLLQAQAAGKNYSREVWGLMQFAIWHRLFVEPNGDTMPSAEENPLDWL